MDLREGQIFASDFRVERELGRGGMGVVYRVLQLSTDKPRALKVMSRRVLHDARAAQRFLQEAKVASKVESEHIVEVIAAGVEARAEGPIPWLVMELLEGESLADAVERQGAFSPAQVDDILRQLCHGLGAAHRAGLVHRDVKPDNVFLAISKSAESALRVKLLDFGIAKALRPTVGGAGSATAPMGTPLFMAPEQTRAGVLDARADVWALGLLAFYMLTGRHYWLAAGHADTPLTALLVEVTVDRIVRASERARAFGVELPPAFDDWFSRCVARDIDARWADAATAYRAFSGELTEAAIAETMPLDASARKAPSAGTDPTTDDDATDKVISGLEETVAAQPPVQSVPARAMPERSAPSNALVLGAGLIMLVVGAIAVGWSMRGAESGGAEGAERAPQAARAPETVATSPDGPQAPRSEANPTEARSTEAHPTGADALEVTASGAGTAADPGSNPAGGATSEEGTTPPARGSAPDVAAARTSARSRAPGCAQLSPRDRAPCQQFAEAAALGCRMFMLEERRDAMWVTVSQRLSADASPLGWRVTPDRDGLRRCLAARAGYVRWPRTGQERELTFRFRLAAIPFE